MQVVQKSKEKKSIREDLWMAVNGYDFEGLHFRIHCTHVFIPYSNPPGSAGRGCGKFGPDGNIGFAPTTICMGKRSMKNHKILHKMLRNLNIDNFPEEIQPRKWFLYRTTSKNRELGRGHVPIGG